ncbi:DUF835 domain-containing protein [Thermococcus sp.]|uniref:DUF835 domain-containing protein n=1 Tax=Thermococcus sp. TaxID=35749 RepID=UPI00260CACA2|nr:DUF835 domain-containing protein [Thermococcus sp.]
MRKEKGSNLNRITFEVVEKLGGATPKELLSYTIMNEEAEVEYYARLAGKAKKPSIKLIFKRMSEESEKHAYLLRRLFGKLFPEEEPVRVEAPPVEVHPLYPKLESVGDYFEALEYCMESELFAKRTYELLATMAEDEEVKELAMNLVAMEQDHYEELKKVYDLLKILVEKKLLPETLKPGGYLFTDDLKAKYFLLELAEAGVKVKALLRQKPCGAFREIVKALDVLWVTKVDAENSVKPSQVPRLKGDLTSSLKGTSEESRKGAIFIENLGYLTVELGFKKAVDFVLYLKDSALLYKGYVIVTANPEAFDKKEWALLTYELKLVP